MKKLVGPTKLFFQQQVEIFQFKWKKSWLLAMAFSCLKSKIIKVQDDCWFSFIFWLRQLYLKGGHQNLQLGEMS